MGVVIVKCYTNAHLTLPSAVRWGFGMCRSLVRVDASNSLQCFDGVSWATGL